MRVLVHMHTMNDMDMIHTSVAGSTGTADRTGSTLALLRHYKAAKLIVNALLIPEGKPSACSAHAGAHTATAFWATSRSATGDART